MMKLVNGERVVMDTNEERLLQAEWNDWEANVRPVMQTEELARQQRQARMEAARGKVATLSEAERIQLLEDLLGQ